MNPTTAIGWENMGIAPGRSPLEQRLLDLRLALTRAGDGVVRLAREAWDFMGTPDFDRMMMQVGPIAPLIVGAVLGSRKGASALAKLSEMAAQGDKNALRFFEIDIPAEAMESRAEEFLEAAAKGKEELAAFFRRVTSFKTQDERRFVSLNEAMDSQARVARFMEEVTARNMDPVRVRSAFRDLLSSGEEEQAAKLLTDAARGGAFAGVRTVLRPSKMDRYTGNAITPKMREDTGYWLGNFRRMLSVAGLETEMARRVPDPYVAHFLGGHGQSYAHTRYVLRGGPEPEQAKEILLRTFHDLVLEKIKRGEIQLPEK